MVNPDKVPVLSSNLASGILFMKAEKKGSLGSRGRPEIGVIGVAPRVVGLIGDIPKPRGRVGVAGDRGV